jgi:hypothetical protein
MESKITKEMLKALMKDFNYNSWNATADADEAAMKNADRKRAIEEFLDQMVASGYKIVEVCNDKIVFDAAPASNFPSLVTFTRSAIDDIIFFDSTDSDY